MWRRVRRTHALRAMALVIALGAGSSRSAAQLICGPLNPGALLGINQTCNATRNVSIFVGTLTPIAVPLLPSNLVWSSDGLAASVRDVVSNDPASDPRLTFAALDLLVVTPSGVAWVLAGPDNLPNALVLRGAALDATFGVGGLALGPATLLRGATEYLLQNEFTAIGGPCNAFGFCAVLNNYRANVTVFQQNADWTLSNQTPSPTITPEPGTLSLLGAGMLTGLIARRRRQIAVTRGETRSATRSNSMA